MYAMRSWCLNSDLLVVHFDSFKSPQAHTFTGAPFHLTDTIVFTDYKYK